MIRTAMKVITPEFSVLDIGFSHTLTATGTRVQILEVEGRTALAAYPDGELVLVRKGEYVGTVTYAS